VGAEATFCGICGATLRAATNTKKYILIGGIALLVLALAGVGVWYFFLRGGGGIPVSFTEKLLATMPRDLRVENYNVEFSPDGTRAAYIAKKEGSNKEFVVADGKSGKEYDQVRDLVFSLDATK